MTPTNFLRYFRSCLADEKLMGLTVRIQDNEKAKSVATADLRNGFLPSDVVDRLFAEYTQMRKSAGANAGSEDVRHHRIRVVITPFYLAQKQNHGRSSTYLPEALTPLWMEALLDSNGKLSPSPDRMPWIARNLLEPTTSRITLGTINDYDALMTQNSVGDIRTQDWKPYFEFAANILGTVGAFNQDDTGQMSFSCGEVKYVDIGKGCICPSSGMKSATMHIQALVDSMLEDNARKPLFESLFAQQEPRNGFLSTFKRLEASKNHLGQMHKRYGLGPSQRESITHIFAGQTFESHKENLVHAVNGPPGTGKTELLKSVVATLMARACVEGADIPPVIAATSANNQAVSNIIKDFGTGIFPEKPERPLERRWLPEPLHSLGLYAITEQKKEQNQSFHCTTPGKRFHEDLENAEYLARGKEFFLASARAQYEDIGPSATVSDVLERLLADARRVHSEIVRQCDLLARAARGEHDLPGITAKIEELSARSTASAEKCEKACDELLNARQKHQDAEKLLGVVLDYIRSEPFYYSLLSFLGAVRFKRAASLEATIRATGLPVTFQVESPQKVVTKIQGEFMPHVDDQLRDALRIHENAENENLKILAELEEERKLLKDIRETIAQACAAFQIDDFDEENLNRAHEEIDRGLRYDLFLLSVHYFEAKWLMAAADIKPKKSLTAKDKRAIWHRDAMLTPCIVATAFMLPRFFRHYPEYHFNFIDLLIIDEAGQASPEKLAPLFALAKQALVVGDKHQIEPIWGISKYVDMGNLIEDAKIPCPDNEIPERVLHLSASRGSAMLMAQQASAVQLPDYEEPGLHLREHRRCQETVINFCRELIYPKLEVKTSARPRPLGLPPMGYLHIPGQSQRSGSSLKNEYEAANIAKWISDNAQALRTHFENKLALKDIIGVVTPYASQAQAIWRALANAGLGREKITVGTVHSLQGAEKPIVLFSPGYGPNDTTSFIDRTPNLLNVAVSRAKDSFLVFGNMDAFSRSANTPSSMLMRHVMNGEVVAPLIPRGDLAGSPKGVQHLTTLDEHRAHLKEAFETSRGQILLVSPWIRKAALDHDQIPLLVERACGRGVQVRIYSDRTWNKTEQDVKAFDSCVQQLREAGAEVKLVASTHNKTMIICKVPLLRSTPG